MARIRLPYVKEYQDQHGKPRRYFRRRGYKLVPLPGVPGSKEFMDAYQSALTDKIDPGLSKELPGVIGGLVAAYYQSASYKNLAPITRAAYRSEIERFRREHGMKLVSDLRRDHVERIIAQKAENPGAANKLLRTIKLLMRFAIAARWRQDDPTMGVKKLKIRNGGFRAWSEGDIETFRLKHPGGTRARLALELLLYTAQRRSDVITMGWQHVRGSFISVRQQKTGTALDIPIHPDLAATLASEPRTNLTFLLTSRGSPFTPAGFGNWFGDCCRAAGLPAGFNAHGIRKAAARRLAEAGCTANEIGAITGHRTLQEVERYTRSANQRQLATNAMQRLGVNPEQEVSHQVSHPPKPATKSDT